MYIKLPLLEEFLRRFLNEAKIEKKSNENELTTISVCISSILKLADLKANAELVFTAFRNLGYPVSVLEPTDMKKPQPYIDTCSHAIYIGIDSAEFKKLQSLLPSINNKTLSESQKLFAKVIKEFLEAKG